MEEQKLRILREITNGLFSLFLLLLNGYGRVEDEEGGNLEK